jgi:hypothetical protein
MKKSMNIIASSLLMAGILALTACDSGMGSSASPSPAVTASPTVSMTPSASPSPSPTAVATVTPTPTPSAVSPTTAPSEVGSADTSKMLKEMLELAKQGKAQGIEYAADKGLIDEVEKAWGKADKQEPAGKGFYATYSKKNVVFGFNKGMQIFDVRSNDPKLTKLTLKQIEQALGKPADTKANGEDTIYIYNANDQFQLKFVIPKSTGKVDHISVFCPKDAVNLMAG